MFQLFPRSRLIQAVALVVCPGITLGACSTPGFDFLQQQGSDAAARGTAIAIGRDSAGDAVIQRGTAQPGAARAIAGWPQNGGDAANHSGNRAARISGAMLWRTPLSRDEPVRAAARPVYGNALVYVYRNGGEVTALDSATGQTVWRARLAPEDAGDDRPPGGGIVLSQDRVFVATGHGEIAALDAANGAIVWRHSLDAAARGAPAAGAGRVFVMSQTNAAFAFDRNTGAPAWMVDGIPETVALLSAPSPAIGDDGLVVMPFSSGELIAFEATSGKIKWARDLARATPRMAISGLVDIAASPVIFGQSVIASGVSGRTASFRLADGRIDWSADLATAHTPVVSGNAVFLVDLAGRLVALDRENGDILWARPLPDTGGKNAHWAGPLLADGLLYILSDTGSLAVFDAVQGEPVRLSGGGMAVYVAPILADDRLIALTANDTVIAYR